MIAANKMSVPSCLKDYVLFDTRSEGRAHDGASRSFAPHTLRFTKPSNDFNFIHSHAFLDEISLAYTSYGTALTIEPEPMDEFYLVQIPVTGGLLVEHGGKQISNARGTASIISPTQSTRLNWGKDCGILTVKVNRSAIENRLEMLTQSDIDDPVIFDLNMDLADPKTRNWYIESLRLMQHFQYAGKKMDAELEENFEDRYIDVLLDTQTSNYTEKLLGDSVNISSKAVLEAIDYLHANMDKRISLGQLASVVKVNSRTLHNGFKRFRSQSPLEYLNSIRLRRARRLLKRAGSSDSVTSVAQSVGFTHLGRFSQQYSARFGEKPSQTLRGGCSASEL